MKVGVRLVWKNPERPVGPPRTTAVLYVQAKNERQVLLAAKRLQDSYEADDYQIVG
jgi:hypothetical protein